MSYTDWVEGPDGATKIEGRSIFIQGGAGVAQKAKTGSDIWTPLGRMTEVSDEDMGLLERNQVFQLHQKNGFIKVQKKSADVEKVVADMNRADKSAPLTEASFPAELGITVSTDVPKSTARPGL
jgi:hypothetical protein